MAANDLKLILSMIASMFILAFGHSFGMSQMVLIGLIWMLLIVVKNYKHHFINIMLFYLPFAPILKITPTGFSFFTIALIIVMLLFGVSIKLRFDPRIVLLTICIFFVTSSAKLLFGNGFSLDYITFTATLLFIPIFVKTYKNNILFEKNTYFLALGIISAGTLSYVLKSSENMQAYIYVYEWAKVDLVRFSGFYGDANYYSAQILAAITSLLILLTTNKKNILLNISLIVALVFFGLLSVSKMFIFSLSAILTLWFFAQMRFQEMFWIRLAALISVLALVFIVSFTKVIDTEISMYNTRFGMTDTVSSLTTGRSDIFANYVKFFISHPYMTLIGQGYSKVYYEMIDFRAAHNTILQLFYQLGVIGVGLMVVWINMLRKLFDNRPIVFRVGALLLYSLLFIGVFLPWLSLDMLFIDDFFFMIILYFSGVVYLNGMNIKTEKEVT